MWKKSTWTKQFDPENGAWGILIRSPEREEKILIKTMIDVFLIDFINTFASFPPKVPSRSLLSSFFAALAFSVACNGGFFRTARSESRNFNLLDVGSWPIAYQREREKLLADWSSENNVNRVIIYDTNEQTNFLSLPLPFKHFSLFPSVVPINFSQLDFQWN